MGCISHRHGKKARSKLGDLQSLYNINDTIFKGVVKMRVNHNCQYSRAPFPPLRVRKEAINPYGDSDVSGEGLWSLTLETQLPGKTLQRRKLRK